jgi:hypothetical protein
MISHFTNGEASCPACGHHLDRATNALGDIEPPHEGDISVCINCAETLMFDENLKLKIATEEDLESLPDGALEVIESIKQFIAFKNANKDLKEGN